MIKKNKDLHLAFNFLILLKACRYSFPATKVFRLMVRGILTPVLLLLFFFPLSGKCNDYFFSTISLQHGLSQITANCIFQDSQGYIWIGTRGGLNRYNGYEFEVFKNQLNNPHSLSENHVSCMNEDDKGNLWIGTSNGLNKLNRSTGRIDRIIFEHKKGKNSNLNFILSLLFDSDSQSLWIGSIAGLKQLSLKDMSVKTIEIPVVGNTPVHTIIRRDNKFYLGTDKGLIISGYPGNGTKVFDVNSPDGSKLPDDLIRDMIFDSNGRLWIATRNGGVAVLQNDEKSFVIVDEKSGLTNNFVRTLAVSPDGKILAGTFNGLNVIDPESYQVIKRYDSYIPEKNELSHYSILDVFFDKSGGLWVGTYGGGVSYSNPYENRFRFIDPNKNLSNVLGVMGPMIEFAGKIYVASEGGGLIEYDEYTGLTQQYRIYNSPYNYDQNIIKSLYLDGDKILCGTNLGTVYAFHIPTKRFSLFHDFREEKTIYYISRSVDGELIVGSVSTAGLNIFRKDNSIENSFYVKGYHGDFTFSNLRTILQIDKDTWFIGTRANGIYKYNLKTGEMMQYENLSKDKSLPDNYISTLFRDSRNTIWAGTYGGGLCKYNKERDEWQTIDTNNGLQNNYVCQIVEDANKNLWISTINGISMYNPVTGRFRNYSYQNGIKVNEFSQQSGIVLKNNSIVMGGNNGFIIFRPQDLRLNSYVPPIVFGNLYVNNNLVQSEDITHILKQPLNEQKEITLQYDQSNFSIEFCALSYVNSQNNKYEYMLEGFDKGWNKVGSRRMAYYTNIPAGKYTFRVKASNNDGVWNTGGRSISIIVLPPFWKTWWAYGLYLLLGGGIAYLIIYYNNKKRELENNVKIKQIEVQTKEAFHQERTKLFTNFSHELRTPLTLILSPLDDLLEGKTNDRETTKTLRTMRENAQRMLRLVNNLMDFRKNESGMLQVHVAKTNISVFIADMFQAFEEMAQKRNILYTLKQPPRDLMASIDKDLIEKVLFNLLSNAFKNTEDNGQVTLDVSLIDASATKASLPAHVNWLPDANSSYIRVKITDNGIGIQEEDLEKIFAPFYQVAQNEHATSGTGLGLSLSKSIVELHQGVIWVESQYGAGASFCFLLPTNKDLFLPQEFDSQPVEKILPQSEVATNHDLVQSGSMLKKYKILVVEDNKEIRNYVLSHLSTHYFTIEAANGKAAYEKALIEVPDMIITDLMMPKMGGMELTKALRENKTTAHIPIIMITARAMAEDKIEGYETGADDYITKPFSGSVLLSRVKNIFDSREKLKTHFEKRLSVTDLGIDAVPADERFIQELYLYIESNISNPDLSVDGLCTHFNMSQSNFYRKIKNITSNSPKDIIKNYRLEMASKMLLETDLSISDVYIATGFNSIAYFSNTFKAHFGESPSDYIRKNRGKKNPG